MSWLVGADFLGFWDLIKDIKIGWRKKKPLTVERKKILVRRAKEKKHRRLAK